jgi:AbrB family looped-hinge helix DNA binding protein
MIDSSPSNVSLDFRPASEYGKKGKRKEAIMGIGTTRLSSKGQIVIPKRIREELGLEEGEDLVVIARGSQIIIRRLALEDLIEEAREAYRRGQTKTTEEVFKSL